MTGMDVAVVGAGVVGCALASALARHGLSVVVLERAAQEGTGITARNSGVIHGGLYYPPGSLKAITCLRGQALLYALPRCRRPPYHPDHLRERSHHPLGTPRRRARPDAPHH